MAVTEIRNVHYLGPTTFGEPVQTACYIDWRKSPTYLVARTKSSVTCRACKGILLKEAVERYRFK